MTTFYAQDSLKSGSVLADLALGRWGLLNNASSNFSLQSTKGRFGGQSLQYSTGGPNTPNLTKTLAAGAQATLSVHAPLRVDSTGSGVFFQFMDGTAAQISMRVNGDNTISLLRGGSGGTVLATSSFALTSGVYYVFELKVTFHSSAGTYELRAIGPGSNATNSAIIGPTSSANTSGSGAAQATAIRLGAETTFVSGLVMQFEHFVCLDGFVGDKRFYTSPPTGNSAAVWTPNASTNLSRVQETQQDGDTSYVSSSNPGDTDYYSYPALPAGVQGIVAVVNSIWARKDDAGARSVRTKIKQGSTVVNGATVNMSTTYAEQYDIAYVDPVSGIAFVKSDVDSLLRGFEMVS